MSGERQSRLPIDSDSLAEVVFLLVLIWMLAGPLSGAVLTAHTWISAMFTKSAQKIESTKNLANQLLDATHQIHFLEKRLADSQLELTKLRQQSKDTSNLRSLLGLKNNMRQKTIAAEIVTRDPDNWFQQVTIDKGRMDGVTLGSAVITMSGVVGQVTSLSEKASVVRLLTDPDQKLGVMIARIGQPGILAGREKHPAAIDFVPLGTAVDCGDKVVTLGNGGIFPAGHPVGVVSSVRRDTNGTSLTIEVRLSENYYDLKQVLIVPPAVTE